MLCATMVHHKKYEYVATAPYLSPPSYIEYEEENTTTQLMARQWDDRYNPIKRDLYGSISLS